MRLARPAPRWRRAAGARRAGSRLRPGRSCRGDRRPDNTASRRARSTKPRRPPCRSRWAPAGGRWWARSPAPAGAPARETSARSVFELPPSTASTAARGWLTRWPPAPLAGAIRPGPGRRRGRARRRRRSRIPPAQALHDLGKRRRDRVGPGVEQDDGAVATRSRAVDGRAAPPCRSSGSHSKTSTSHPTWR